MVDFRLYFMEICFKMHYIKVIFVHQIVSLITQTTLKAVQSAYKIQIPHLVFQDLAWMGFFFCSPTLLQMHLFWLKILKSSWPRFSSSITGQSFWTRGLRARSSLCFECSRKRLIYLVDSVSSFRPQFKHYLLREAFSVKSNYSSPHIVCRSIIYLLEYTYDIFCIVCFLYHTW